VKGHPGHAETSQLVAECVERAIKKSGVPEGTFGHVHGKSFEVGKALVQHPVTKAVGFTGSYGGGKALYDMANERTEPIPVFSEMGSINPVFLLPSAIKNRGEAIANSYADSITLSAGQFCTNPGLLLGVKGNELTSFANTLGSLVKKVAPTPMLHPGIASSFHKNRKEALKQRGVELVAESSPEPSDIDSRPTLASVSLEDFVNNEKLREEVFGPYSLLVQGINVMELHRALETIPGQLTATIIGDDDDLKEFADFISLVREKAGRLIINGVPTGVEVCPSMQHGGPFPSTTDSRFTSVGTDAIKRFVRPVSFQNFPPFLLPDELKDENPLNIWRLLNSDWTKDKV
jgi:NADP-dependent aldehyde dehydrogenase